MALTSSGSALREGHLITDALGLLSPYLVLLTLPGWEGLLVSVLHMSSSDKMRNNEGPYWCWKSQLSSGLSWTLVGREEEMGLLGVTR